MNLKITKSGFTLLEMLLVIAIIAILAGIVIVAINPGRQLAQARNTQRSSDLRAIHSAVQQYYIDNKEWPTSSLSGTLQEICDENNEPSGCLDLSELVPTYLPAIPKDPQAEIGTNYQIAINPNSQTPELTAPSSTEYELTPVQLGTTTLTISGLGGSTWACGDDLVDDRDSQSYTTVLIGTQCWMQENLNIGTMVSGATVMSNNSIIEKYCYDNNTTNCDNYGGLYRWDEAMQYVTTGSQGICPTGWHIPTHDEYTDLEIEICTSGTCATDFPYDNSTFGWRGTDEGSKLSNLTLNGNNSTGFSGLFSGYCYPLNSFTNISGGTRFWSSTQHNSTDSFVRYLSSSSAQISRAVYPKDEAYSVRCLMD